MTQQPFPSLEELIAAYDKKAWREIDEAHHRLIDQFGLIPLLPQLIVACQSVKSWKGRKTLLFYFLPHVREFPALLDLTLGLVNDRAGMVREEALGIIAYSLEDRALPELRKHLNHADPETRASVVAAIDAIENKDHNLFLDRDHTGNTNWIVRPRCRSFGQPETDNGGQAKP